MIITTTSSLASYTNGQNWILGIDTKDPSVPEGQVKLTSIWDKDSSSFLNLDNHSSSLAI